MRKNIIIIVLFVALIGLSSYVTYNKINLEENKGDSCEQNDANIEDNINSDENNSSASDNNLNNDMDNCVDENIIINNEININLYRDTKLSFPAGHENGILEVENGNIKFTSPNYSRTLSGLDAKYIYLSCYMSTEQCELYYITNNDELYRIKRIFRIAYSQFEISSIIANKISNNKVIAFLGKNNAPVYNDESDLRGHMYNLNVLLSDGNVETIVTSYIGS